MSTTQNVRVRMEVGSAASAPLPSPIISVAGRTGTVVLANTDISGLGTASVLDVGTTANNVVQLNGSAQLPAVDGSQLTSLAIGPHINSATAKTTPVDADMLALMDSEAANVLKKFSWANVKTVLYKIFARLSGAAGGQTLIGGTAASENLTLSSTSDSTKGAIIFGTASKYDHANDRLGLGTLTPAAKVHAISTTEQLRVGYDGSNFASFTVNSTGQLKVAAPLTFRPPSSISPGSSGDLTFEATSDHSLTIRYRGSDDVVRYVDLPLTASSAIYALLSGETSSGHRAAHEEIVSWEDLQCPPEAFNPAGAPSPPTIDDTTVPGTWLFSGTGTAINNLAVIRQFPHAWKAGSEIKPHIHYEKTTTGAGNVIWQWRYSIANVGDTFPAYSAWILSTDVISPSNIVRKHALATFPAVDMTGKKESCMICIQIRRDAGNAADTYADSARFLEFDIHYQTNKAGTENEYPS